LQRFFGAGALDGGPCALGGLLFALDLHRSGKRIGLAHYNTAEEIDRLLGALREIGG